MAFSSYGIERFGGLRLDLEVDELGPSQAVDLLNVDFDKRGSVRVRDGYASISTGNASNYVSGPFPWGGSSRYALSAADGKIYLRSNSGLLLSTSVAYTGQVNSVAEFGTATTSRLFLATLAGVDTIIRISGTTFSKPASMPASSLIAVQPSDNRLVAANITTLPSGSAAAAASPSLVHFSDAGDAETWGANNWELLTPNDGQTITGITAWRDYLFVFKERRFFVFYGNSTDNDGNPVFNYRTIDTGVGNSGNATGVTNPVVAPDGVYFMDTTGVYRTTGGPPEKVSGAIDPLFSGLATFSSTAPATVWAAFAPCGYYYRNKVVFLCTDAGGSTYWLIYDTVAGNWTIWQTAATPTGACVLPSRAPAFGALSAGTLHRFDPTLSTDNGSAIVSRYRSGFYTPLGDAARECTVRESIIDGIGTPTFSVARDFATSLPTTDGGAKATVTLGTSPTIAQGRHQKSQRGRRFSYQIEATSGAWRVNSITQNLTGFRGEGMKTT